jgi:hypothetical protein
VKVKEISQILDQDGDKTVNNEALPSSDAKKDYRRNKKTQEYNDPHFLDHTN